MFAQYISRSKDQHRVFVQAGQSIQIHPDSDIIQILSEMLSQNYQNILRFIHDVEIYLVQ